MVVASSRTCEIPFHAAVWIKGNSDQTLTAEEEVIFGSLVRMNATNKLIYDIETEINLRTY